MINENKLSDFSKIKTIMMITIVLYHSIALWLPEGWFNQQPSTPSTFLRILSTWLNYIHVYVFVFVSGYLFSYLKIQKGKYKSFSELMKKKFKRLIIPYITTSITWCIPFYILFFQPSIINVLKNYLFGYAPNQLWFLLMLFNVFIIAYFLHQYIIKMDLKNVFIISFVIYLFYIIINNYITLPFQLVKTIQFLPFFLIGMNYDRMNKILLKKNIYVFFLMINMVLFAIQFLIPLNANIYVKVIKKIIDFFISINGTLFVVNFMCSIKNASLFNKKIYKIIENNSFNIYLFHQQIIWTIIYLCNGRTSPLLMILMSFFISIIVSILISIVIKKFKITSKMFGN